MKFATTKKEIQKIVKKHWKKGAVSMMNALNCALIEVKGGEITISSTNLDYYLTTTLAAEAIEEGAVTLPIKKLSKVVKSLPSGEIIVEWIGGDVAKIGPIPIEVGPPAEDFPGAPKPISGPLYEVSGKVLKESLKTVLPLVKACGTGALNLKNVAFHKKVVLGSDGHRLVVVKMPFTLEGDEFFLLPVEEATKLCQVIDLVEGNVTFRVVGKNEDNTPKPQILIKAEGFSFWALGFEGLYPEYWRIFPQKAIEAVVDVASLKAAAEIVTAADANLVIFSVEDNRGLLTGAQKEVRAEFKAVAPDTIKFVINGAYLLEALRGFQGEKVNLYFNGPQGHPVVFAAFGLKHLVMPLAPDEDEMGKFPSIPEDHPALVDIPDSLDGDEYRPKKTKKTKKASRKASMPKSQGQVTKLKAEIKELKAVAKKLQDAALEAREETRSWQEKALKLEEQVRNLLKELERLAGKTRKVLVKEPVPLVFDGSKALAELDGNKVVLTKGRIQAESGEVLGAYDSKTGFGFLAGSPVVVANENGGFVLKPASMN